MVIYIIYLFILNGFLVFPARERTISPADLQGILGMMAYDQRTGSTRGLSSYFPRGFNPRGSRQVQYCIEQHMFTCTYTMIVWQD